MVIVPPIAAFVAAGFEHSIANLYLLPYGLAIQAWAGPEFWFAIGQTATDYPHLSLAGVLHNLVVATIGYLVGGSVMVGAVLLVRVSPPTRLGWPARYRGAPIGAG